MTENNNLINGVPLTSAWLQANVGNPINLIKAYRQFSGKGLAESKAAVDNCRMDKLDFRSSIVIPQLLTLFAPYLPNTDKHNQALVEEKLVDGIHCAFANYDKLGYSSPWILVANLIDNLRD